MKYAQDPHQPDLLRSISTWSEQRAPDATAWFLIDGAMLDRTSRATLVSRARVAHQPLKGTIYSEYGDYGPWLLQPPVSRSEEWLKELYSATSGRPALTIIETPVHTDKLSELLFGLSASASQTEPTLYCRFADTRVLPALLAVLTEPQLTMLSATIRRWSFVNRSGALAELCLPNAHKDDTPTDCSLHLDAAQIADIIGASDADAVFSLLSDTSPDLIPRDKLGKFYDQIDRGIGAARRHGVSSAADQLQFTILSIIFGEDFHLSPVLASTWRTISTGATTLASSVSSWDETIWRTLEKSKT